MNIKIMDTVAFSNKKIGEINGFLAANFSPNCFFAINYTPKKPSGRNCDEAAVFWCAVTNLNAMYTDCMPARQPVLRDLFLRSGINTCNDLGDIRDWNDEISTLKALRTAYCHNISGGRDSYQNKQTLTRVRSYFNQEEDDEDCLCLPSDKEIKVKNYVEKLCNAANARIDCLLEMFGKAAKDGAAKAAFIKKMEKSLAEWLAKKDLYYIIQNELKLTPRNIGKPLGTEPDYPIMAKRYMERIYSAAVNEKLGKDEGLKKWILNGEFNEKDVLVKIKKALLTEVSAKIKNENQLLDEYLIAKYLNIIKDLNKSTLPTVYTKLLKLLDNELDLGIYK